MLRNLVIEMTLKELLRVVLSPDYGTDMSNHSR